MNIYTSYFAYLSKVPKTFVPISIAGKSPYSYKGLKYKKLAPKYEWWKVWAEQEERDYEFYKQKYKETVLDKLTIEEVLNDLEVLAQGNDNVLLCCWEGPEAFCHRHLVADWMNERDQNVKEYNIDPRFLETLYTKVLLKLENGKKVREIKNATLLEVSEIRRIFDQLILGRSAETIMERVMEVYKHFFFDIKEKGIGWEIFPKIPCELIPEEHRGKNYDRHTQAHFFGHRWSTQ